MSEAPKQVPPPATITSDADMLLLGGQFGWGFVEIAGQKVAAIRVLHPRLGGQVVLAIDPVALSQFAEGLSGLEAQGK